MALTDNSRPFHGNAEVHGLDYPEGARFAEDIALSRAETRVPAYRYTSPAGSLDQLRYLVSFEDASGALVPDSLDATNIAISTTDGAVTDCHGNPVTNPAISAAASSQILGPFMTRCNTAPGRYRVPGR